MCFADLDKSPTNSAKGCRPDVLAGDPSGPKDAGLQATKTACCPALETSKPIHPIGGKGMNPRHFLWFAGSR